MTCNAYFPTTSQYLMALFMAFLVKARLMSLSLKRIRSGLTLMTYSRNALLKLLMATSETLWSGLCDHSPCTGPPRNYVENLILRYRHNARQS